MKKRIIYLVLMALIGWSCSSDNNDTPNFNDDDQGGSNDDDQGIELTAIPDEAFEQALIDLSFDDVLDGSIRTASAQNILELVLNEKGISDLTGIQDFTNLENLWVQDNELTAINVSQNQNLKFLFFDQNQIEELDVTNLAVLEKIGAIDNLLTEINVSNNPVLNLLDLTNNGMTAIDVSTNNELFQFSIVGNPLTCIKVNSNQLADIPDGWEKDPEDEYAIKCQ